MNPTTMLADFAKEGVVLSLNTHGGIRASGGREAVARMLPIIKQHKPELLAALAGRPLQATPQPETLMDECKRLTVEIMVAMGVATFTYQGKALVAGNARAVAFAQLDQADQDELEDFVRCAGERLAELSPAKQPTLAVTVRTPNGNPVTVQARDEAHAAWIKRMNPTPETLLAP